jgi:hypothetical protein
LASYVELIRDLGYHRHRVLFDTPQDAGQLDLEILDDVGRIVICGEAKREARQLDALFAGLHNHAEREPPFKRGDEPGQLAWRLRRSQARFLWLVAPSDRRAYRCTYEPLRLEPLPALPTARDLGLEGDPGGMLTPPRIT